MRNKTALFKMAVFFGLRLSFAQSASASHLMSWENYLRFINAADCKSDARVQIERCGHLFCYRCAGKVMVGRDPL